MGMNEISQQAAIAQNRAAAESLNQLAKLIDGEKKDSGKQTKRAEEKSILQKALDRKGDAGVEILANLANQLAQNMPTAKLLNKLQQEYGFVLDQKEESAEDAADITSFTALDEKAKARNQAKNKQVLADIFQSADPNAKESAAGVKEYISAYSQLLLNGGEKEAKKKLDKLEKQLVEEKGIPLKELMGVKVRVANTVRTDILHQIKDAYLKKVLSKEKSVEWLIADRELSKNIDYAFGNDKIGGYDFGGMDGNLDSAVKRGGEEVREQLKDYTSDALNEKAINKALGNEEKGREKDLETILRAGQKVGFDIKEYIEKLPQVRHDLGLDNILEFTADIPNGNMDNNGGGKHRYQYNMEEEKDILTDKLRAVYLQRALYGDLRTVVETQFKMIKLKNGLISLGVKNFDQVEAEGGALAKVKLIEVLREAFEERATYSKLEGEAWKITEKKIKTACRNLEKIDIKLSQTELDIIRDQSNQKMLPVAEHELNLINASIESRGEIAFLTSRKKIMQEVISRISEESGLISKPTVDIKFSIKEAC